MTIRMRSTDRACICGLTGTGKTVLTQYLCTLYEKTGLLIYDPLSQFTAFKPEQRYVPKSNSIREFNNVCRQLCARENVTFVIEEAERYLGQGKEMGDDTFDLINRGRNWGVGIVAVTRRIQRLSKDFFDLCQHVFFFKCGLRSRGYIEDMIGSKETEQILHLKRYRFLYFNVETEESEVRWLNLQGVHPHLEADKPGQEVEPAPRDEPPGEIAPEGEESEKRAERTVQPRGEPSSGAAQGGWKPRR